MSAGRVVYQEVVINDDDAVTMMLQFLGDNRMQLTEVYVETEAAGETHSHQYSYNDGFVGGYGWGGSSSNYEGGGYTGGYELGGSSSNYGRGSGAGWVASEEYPQRDEPASFVEAGEVQWPAWGPEWAEIENTIRFGRTSHEREDDVVDGGHVDHSCPSYPFESSDDDTEEDFRSVRGEEETDDTNDEVAFREPPTPFYTQVPTQFLHSRNDAIDVVPMPVYDPTANLEVDMAFTSKDAVQYAFTEDAMRRNFEWKVKYTDNK
ncbi:unnamed protein product [Linum trigynum]|uniref:Uncharacterized protein n=1 Tax=Linum trigynum TaxID=586398 RepID=A0AAV2EFP4_9ROSI